MTTTTMLHAQSRIPFQPEEEQRQARPTGRFSLECDRINPNHPSSSLSPSSSSPHPISNTRPCSSPNHSRRSALANNNNNNANYYLSSSAPSACSAYPAYNPFSSTEDDIQTTTAAPTPKRERSLRRNSSLKQQRWASRNNDADVLLEGTDLPPVYEEYQQQQQQEQQCSIFGVSATTMTLSTTTTATSVPKGDTRPAPIASPSSLEAVVQTKTGLGLANKSSTVPLPPHTATTAGIPKDIPMNRPPSSSPPIMQPLKRQKSAKDRVAEREQRRHSSEDGSCHQQRSSPPSSADKYVIPTKCKMVFHMRDEVPRPREEDKTGVSENRFYQYRPQPQPRLRFHPSSPPSSSDDQNPEESVLSPLTSHTPVKKTNNGGVKCAKMVSFKEPEPWRDVTPPPPPPSSSLPSSLSSTPSQNEKELSSDGQESKQVRTVFTRLDVPVITVTQPQASSVRRPSSEPILSGGSTAALSSGTHRHIQATREKSSTPPPRLSPPSSSSSSSEPPSTRTSRHRRNMSMPTQSATMSSATASNVPQRMQAGQGAMVEEPRAKSSSGNRLIRLWRSATQKYSSHHHHQQSNGVGLLAGKGSDLEPLVSMARE